MSFRNPKQSRNQEQLAALKEFSVKSFNGSEQISQRPKPRLIKYEIRKSLNSLDKRIVRVDDLDSNYPSEEYATVKKLELPKPKPKTSTNKKRIQKLSQKQAIKDIQDENQTQRKINKNQEKLTYLALAQSKSASQLPTFGSFIRPNTQRYSLMTRTRSKLATQQPDHLEQQKDQQLESINENYMNTLEDKPYEIQPELNQKEEEDQQTQCDFKKTTFEQDYQFIDEIPLDHPIWKELLPQDIYLNPKINIHRLINENFEYFHHQLGMCACFRCSCGLCKCGFVKNVKMNYSNPARTIYTKDFDDKLQSPNFNRLQHLNTNFYDTKFNDQKTIDLQSLSRSSYKPFTVEPKPKPKIDQEPHKINFGGNSTYLTHYNNWGNLRNEYFKRPNHVSTSDQIPFIGQTLYQQSFCQNNSGQPSDLIKANSQLTTLPMGWMVVQQSQSQRTYQPFKISHNKKMPEIDQVNVINQNNQQMQSPKYDGQFQTLKLQDYQGHQSKLCPAKEFKRVFQKKLIQKMKESGNQ